MFFRIIIFILFFSLSYDVNATSATGLSLGKSTGKDIKEKYTIVKKILNDSDGYTYYISHEEIDLEGIKEAIVRTNKDNIVEGISLEFSDHFFDKYFKILSQKYQDVVYKNIRLVGDKTVVFKDGSNEISIYSPHMSFNMTIMYLTKELSNSLDEGIERREKQQKEQEEKLL